MVGHLLETGIDQERKVTVRSHCISMNSISIYLVFNGFIVLGQRNPLCNQLNHT